MKLEPSELSPLRIFRMFSSSTRAPRQRRPTDVVLLVVGLLVMGLTTVNAPGPTSVDLAIVAVLDEFSGALGWLWEFSYTLLSVWVVVLLLAPVVRHGQGRLRLLWDYGLALVASFALVAGISALGGTSLAETVDALVTADPPPVYAAVRLALVTAVIVTASPHVTRPFSVVGRVLLGLGALAAVALQIAHPSGVAAGWAVGLAAASFVHLVLGSPGGQLTPEQVGEALRDLGVETESVEAAEPRSPGEQLLRARAVGAEDLEVKVFGRDAWDAQYVGSLWSALTRRGEAPRLAMSRRERVEHEAMVSLMAERAGVPVLPVVTSGQGVQGEALLVTYAPARAFADLPPESVDETWLRGAWSALTALHEAGIAHRAITGQHLVQRADGAPALADFAHARLAASRHDLMIDRVHLLVTLALAVGHERAVASAVEALGVDGLTQALPYVQDPVLSAPLRRAMGTEWDLEDAAHAGDRAHGGRGCTAGRAAPGEPRLGPQAGPRSRDRVVPGRAAGRGRLRGGHRGADVRGPAPAAARPAGRTAGAGALLVLHPRGEHPAAALPARPDAAVRHPVHRAGAAGHRRTDRAADPVLRAAGRLLRRRHLHGRDRQLRRLRRAGPPAAADRGQLAARASRPSVSTGSDSGRGRVQRPLPGGDGRADRADLDGGDPCGSPAPRPHPARRSPVHRADARPGQRGPLLAGRAAPSRQGRGDPRRQPGGPGDPGHRAGHLPGRVRRVGLPVTADPGQHLRQPVRRADARPRRRGRRRGRLHLRPAGDRRAQPRSRSRPPSRSASSPSTCPRCGAPRP